MTKTLNQLEKDVDDALCAIYDVAPVDDMVIQAIIEFAHMNKEKIALYIKYR